MNKSILLVGKPGTSKTVFLAQLYLRLQKRKSKLILYDVVKNKSVLNSALESLADGDEPAPTFNGAYKEFSMPIQNGDEKFDLICPEYGGEQINEIVGNRGLTKDWLDSVTNSNNWLFFIRLAALDKSKDIADMTYESAPPPQGDGHQHPDYEISGQIELIELLQILLRFKDHDYHRKQNKIKLTIALTCWDELNTNDMPIECLSRELPLLSKFVSSNWTSDMWSVYGLAALEGSLSSSSALKEEFQTKGPENKGYIIRPDGKRSDDITELIAYAVL